VHLTPREEERLLLAAAAGRARRRLARGAPVGATEATALVCDEICEMAWDGVPLEEVIERARRIVPTDSLLPGVAALVPVLEVEALFPWGSTLVHVDLPFGRPRPAVVAAAGTARLAPGAARHTARLRNTGQRDVWISSHFPLDQVNPAVQVSGPPAGCRLDLPAGEALVVRAGEEREVTVVETAAAVAEPSGQARALREAES
jgi:urease subunit gamma/beta